MKRFLIYTLACLGLFSCTEKFPESTGPDTEQTPETVETISVSQDSFSAEGEGEVLKVKLTSEKQWTAATDSDWLIVSPDHGNAVSGKKIDIIVSPNETKAARTGYVSFTSEDLTKKVKIEQSPIVVLTSITTSTSSLVFSASGSDSKGVSISSPSDFSVKCDAGWICLTDRSGSALGQTVSAGKDIMINILPQANFDSADRTATVTISASGLESVKVSIKQTAERFVQGSAGLPAVWLLSEENATAMRKTFIGPGYVQASRGSAATLSIHRENANQLKETLDYNVASDGALEMRMLGENDYILYNVPVDNLAKGTNVHITASYHSDNSANKYFIFEYLDAGEWKKAAGLKRSADGIEYHYESNGLGLSQAYTPNIDETVTLTEGITNGNLQMRLRCVGNKKYDGAALNFSSNALTRIAAAKTHGTSPIIRLLDGPKPSKTIKVLFVGNSYTYYNWSSYMLKEIAWKEGLEIDVTLSAHSGFTIERHLAHAITTARISEGGFDYAIVQEYNDRLAVIGADLAKGSLGSDAAKFTSDMSSIITSIRKASPSVVALVETSWGTKTGTGSLINTSWTDYKTMQKYVTNGSEHVASQASVQRTLLGEAWEKVRTERPDIEMYHTDLHHPSYAGSYLKACVNYLTLSGKKFGSSPCDCLLDPSTAAYLRSVAESVVIDN